jgi:hypothetical protein
MRSNAEAGQIGMSSGALPLTLTSRQWERMAAEAERLATAVAEELAASSREHEELRDVILVGLLGALEQYQPGASPSFAEIAAPILTAHLRRYHNTPFDELLRQPELPDGAGVLSCG